MTTTDITSDVAYKFTRNTGGVLIIACGALAGEIVAVIEHNQLRHIDLQCLPARYHHRPALIPPALDGILATKQHDYEKIYVAYGDCGTAGGIDRVLEKYQAERIHGPHCFAFFEGAERFAQNEDDITSFFLTDFFCQHFERFMWQELGLDRDDSMVEFVFGNYRKLVYIAQTRQPELKQKAVAIAQRLQLEFEYRYRGYSDLGQFVQSIRPGAKPIQPFFSVTG
ncbi:MAG: DUF1638 domain-containing protein [Thiolinea sp.]